MDIGVAGHHVKTAGSTSERTYYIYVKVQSNAVFELNMAANQNTSTCTVMELIP